MKIKRTSLPMPASAICGVNNAMGARYGALPVSTRTHFQFKYRAFLSRSHLTFAIRFHLLSRRGRAIIFMRESSRDRSTPSSASRTFERINHLMRLTATVSNLGRGAHRGCENDGGGAVEVRAGSFLVWSINGAHRSGNALTSSALSIPA